MARLKTYTAEIDGLHEWIVAAPNQQAALDAFGVNQNLFAQGAAGVTTDVVAVKAAEAQPGVPLRRAKGSKDAFEAAGGGSGWTLALEASTAKAPKMKAPSRRALDEAEAALRNFDDGGHAEIAGLEAQAAVLAKRLDQARAAFDQRRGELQAAVDRAAEDCKAKGG
jgi:hypothetical protein